MTILRWMFVLLIAGLISAGIGVYLLLFTDITELEGVQGLVYVVALITLGLVLLIPAKVYLIMRLMKAGLSKPTK